MDKRLWGFRFACLLLHVSEHINAFPVGCQWKRCYPSASALELATEKKMSERGAQMAK